MATSRIIVLTLITGLIPVHSFDSLRAAEIARPSELRAAHQRVLDGLNVKDAKGNVMERDDERIPALTKKGWELAGAWAVSYIERHPTPSKRDLELIFQDFAPKPQLTKSPDGDFLEYREYSFAGKAARIGASIYV